MQGAAVTYQQDEERWRAVVARDKAADGHFVFSVETTGVYCRPSCAARRPKRENVQFHLSCDQAEAAGFRACKRCKPKQASLARRQVAAVVEACRLIETSETPPKLAELAATVSLSADHFHKVFKQVTGITPKAYATAHRAGRLREILPDSARVTDAIYDAGFQSTGRFYAEATEALGMTPGRYREGGAGETIRFAVGACQLGDVLVAASDAGICAILLGDDAGRLLSDLQDRFRKARLVGGDAAFEAWVAAVVGFVDAPETGLDLPLDIRGTLFQRKVWQALRDIPMGETASYGDIARAIGLPTGARAVATACAANPLAVAIPCHRVVRHDGSLSGYRWGVERKRALLIRERLAQERPAETGNQHTEPAR